MTSTNAGPGVSERGFQCGCNSIGLLDANALNVDGVGQGREAGIIEFGRRR